MAQFIQLQNPTNPLADALEGFLAGHLRRQQMERQAAKDAEEKYFRQSQLELQKKELDVQVSAAKQAQKEHELKMQKEAHDTAVAEAEKRATELEGMGQPVTPSTPSPLRLLEGPKIATQIGAPPAPPGGGLPVPPPVQMSEPIGVTGVPTRAPLSGEIPDEAVNIAGVEQAGKAPVNMLMSEFLKRQKAREGVELERKKAASPGFIPREEAAGLGYPVDKLPAGQKFVSTQAVDTWQRSKESATARAERQKDRDEAKTERKAFLDQNIADFADQLQTGATTLAQVPLAYRGEASRKAKEAGGVDNLGVVYSDPKQRDKVTDLRELANKGKELRSLLQDPDVASWFGKGRGLVGQALQDWFNAAPENVRRAYTLAADLSDKTLRARSGAQINEQEYKRIMRFTADPNAPADKNITNLDNMMNYIGQQLNNLTGTKSFTYTPPPPLSESIAKPGSKIKSITPITE